MEALVIVMILKAIHGKKMSFNVHTLLDIQQYMTKTSLLHSEPLKTWQFIFDYNFGYVACRISLRLKRYKTIKIG